MAQGDTAAADADEADEEPGVARRIARTVTPGYVGRPDTEMNLLGWSLFLGLVILLVPFLPLILAVWGISKLLDALSGE